MLLEIATGAFIALAADRSLAAALKARAARKTERRNHQDMNTAIKFVEEFAEKAVKEIEAERQIRHALHQAHDEVCGQRVAKVSEYRKIEARFHELSGKYLLLEKSPNGKPDVTISDEPIAKKPVRKPKAKKPAVKKAPAKKTVTTKKGK